MIDKIVDSKPPLIDIVGWELAQLQLTPTKNVLVFSFLLHLFQGNKRNKLFSIGLIKRIKETANKYMHK